MTKEDCERRLMDLMDEAYAIAREYNPEINHVSMFRIENHTHIDGHTDDEGYVLVDFREGAE